MSTSAVNQQGNHQYEATGATPQKATLSMGDKSITIEGRAAGLVNGLAFIAAITLSALFVVRALQKHEAE